MPISINRNFTYGVKAMKRLIISLFFGLAAFFTVYFGVFKTADKTAEDILYHNSGGPAEKIKIIKIDDRSIEKLGSYETWDRGIYADLMEALCPSDKVKPAVIGFDIIFGDANDSENDQRFAEACKKHGNTVCAFSYVFEKGTKIGENGNIVVSNTIVSDKIMPYSALRDSVYMGFANALMDNNDGYIRSSFLYFTEDTGIEERSFNAEVYNAYARATGFAPEFPEGPVFTFRYSGKSGEYENVSLCDVLDGSVPANAFNGCIVLVGAYTAKMMDSYYVPVNRSAQMYGVEIHANAVQALMEKKYLHNIPRVVSAFIAGLLTGIIAYICSGASVIKVVAVCILSSAVKVLAGGIIFNMGYSGSIIAVPAFSVIIAVSGTAVHYYSANHAKRSIENAFKKYVAPQVVSTIAKSGKYEIQLGGETRDIAVLFVDIRGFTPLSEKLRPNEVVQILNEYLRHTTSCIFKHGGTLDKFIGDATMAIFNAPFDTDDYIYNAVLAAWDIARGAEEVNKKISEISERDDLSISFGVGVNCGAAVVGNIGCDFRMDYTAIGDTVNTAARLEANAKGGSIYISEAVYEAVKDRITAEEIGEIPLKGKSNAVCVYSVTGICRENNKENIGNAEVDV